MNLATIGFGLSIRLKPLTDCYNRKSLSKTDNREIIRVCSTVWTSSSHENKRNLSKKRRTQNSLHTKIP